jgi:hypothetical protein
MRHAIVGLVVLLAGCGCGVIPGTGAAATPTPTAAPTVASTVVPTATRAPVPATATLAPKATDTPQPAAAAETVWVGNTDGEGVYLRKTPVMDDRIRAYADGTALTIIGEDVEGDGQSWKHVRTPDGLEGYVPSMYTTDSPP